MGVPLNQGRAGPSVVITQRRHKRERQANTEHTCSSAIPKGGSLGHRTLDLCVMRIGRRPAKSRATGAVPGRRRHGRS